MMNGSIDHTHRFSARSTTPDPAGIFVVAWLISYVVNRVNRIATMKSSFPLDSRPEPNQLRGFGRVCAVAVEYECDAVVSRREEASSTTCHKVLRAGAGSSLTKVALTGVLFRRPNCPG